MFTENQEYAVNFGTFVFNWICKISKDMHNWICKIFKEYAKFPRRNLICNISETEGRRKLKFSEDSLQICQKILRENRAKKFPTWMPF